MPFKQQMASATGIPAAKLPASYQLIGQVMILKLPGLSEPLKKKVADAVLQKFPAVTTVCESMGVQGEFREPVIQTLAGGGTVTVHKENGIVYKIDVSKVMFSKGNLTERQRLISQVAPGERIIDMFAGIGYFSLGLAKFSPAANVLAIEKNSAAYNLLIENIHLNKITTLNAIQGDCKIAARGLPAAADRVIMGYFPGTEQFLPAAIFMAKPGAMIHFHNTYHKDELWKKPLADVTAIAQGMKRNVTIVAKKKVKGYAPNVFHAVMDIRVA